MKGSRNYNRRFAVQSIVLFLVMSAIAFLGVYTSGSTAYRSANRLGTMTADYLHTQIDALLQQYNQILEDAVYMADTMLADGRTASDIEDWITSFSQEYNETMQYDENGLYGVIRGQGVYSSGWQPDETYDIYSRPWYRQALQSPGAVARSQVYNDARTGTTMISLSKLLSDGESVLALDIRVGDIQVDWQEGSDAFPGTATVVDQDGNVVLRQSIGQEHVSCELDDFTPDDYRALLANLTGNRGMYRWDGAQDRYQMYYIRTSDNWTFLVTIPRSVITQDATTLFYVQLLFQGLFLLIIIYLCLRNYYTLRQNRQVQRSLEAVGQTYDCLVQVDAVRNRCDVLKLAPPPKKKGPPIKTYSDFLAIIHPTVYRAEDWKTFCDIFSLSRLQALHQGGRLYLEYERRGEDGPRWVSAEALTAPDASGQEPVILAFRQIHDTKCAELEKNRLLQESLQSARQANQAKSDFLSRMSHDMRTPMNAVIGFAAMAKQYRHDPERVDDCVTKITAASQQLLHLISEVLDTAKIEQGKMELRPAPMDLRSHVQETAALFRLQTEAQHQQFVLREPTLTHQWVLLDGSRLDQILNNLLSNAVKYTPAGGTITLQVEELPAKDDGTLLYRFTVSDTGIGMAPDFLKRLFLPFEREDTSMTGKVSGVGLGMAITRHMVQMMGGHIEVSSTQGKGSVFTVLLPCQAAEQAPAPAATAPDDNGAPFTLQGLHFLLAEDNMLNREIAQELLQLEGATVFPVENGQQAVEAFQNAPPGTFDAILMDIQMPVLDGYGAAKAIRALDREDAASIPIFAMTANAFEDDVLAARQAGMNGHIAKPMDMDRMRAVLAANMPPSPTTDA